MREPIELIEPMELTEPMELIEPIVLVVPIELIDWRVATAIGETPRSYGTEDSCSCTY